MRERSKRYNAQVSQVKDDLKEPREVSKAIGLLKQMATGANKRKFTESVDLAVHLNLDTKKADQQFRGSFSLPHGTGKVSRVIVFCDDGDKCQAVLAAGAVKAGGDDLVTEVNGGFMDFDIAISTPKMMRSVGKLGKVLGPRGLMPSPKSGTVTDDVVTAFNEFKGGKIEYRSDAAGNLHLRIGNVSFEENKLADNINAFLKHVVEHRPSTVKGDFVKNITVSSTMGPGIKVAFAAKE